MVLGFIKPPSREWDADLRFNSPESPDSLKRLDIIKDCTNLNIGVRSELLHTLNLRPKPMMFIGLVQYYQRLVRERNSSEQLVLPQEAAELILLKGALSHGALLLYTSSDIEQLLAYQYGLYRNVPISLRQGLETESFNYSRYKKSPPDTKTGLLDPILKYHACIQQLGGMKERAASQSDYAFYHQRAHLYFEAAAQVEMLTGIVSIHQQVNKSPERQGDDLKMFTEVYCNNITDSLLPFQQFFLEEAQHYTQKGLEQALNSVITAPARRSYWTNLLYSPIQSLFKPDVSESIKIQNLRDYLILYYVLSQKIDQASTFIDTQQQRFSKLLETRHLMMQEACYKTSWKENLPMAPLAHYEMAALAWKIVASCSSLAEEALNKLIAGLNEPNKDMDLLLKAAVLERTIKDGAQQLYQSLNATHPLKYAPSSSPSKAELPPSLHLLQYFQHVTSWWGVNTVAQTPLDRAYDAYQLPITFSLSSAPSGTASLTLICSNL